MSKFPLIRVAVKEDWAPVDLFSLGGSYEGLSRDYLHKVEQRLGIRFEYIPYATLPEGLEALKSGQVDIVPSLSRTLEREKQFVFSASYLEVPGAYFARYDGPKIGPDESLRALK